MKRKNIIAGVLVSVISIALAIGITYVAAFSGNGDKTNSTQSARTRTLKPVGAVTSLAEANDPNATATPTPTNNCTFPTDIWLQYPDAWRIDSYRLGDHTYQRSEIIDVLRRDSTNPRDLLLAQVFVVVLNQQNGADATSIRISFSQSIDWLLTFLPGSNPPDGDRQKAQVLTNELEKFNDGLAGPMPCQYNLSEATPVYLPTLPEASLTVSATVRRPAYYNYTDTPKPAVVHTKAPTNPPPPTVPPPKPPTAIPQPTSTPLMPTDIPPDTPVPPTSVPPTSPPPPTNPPPAPTDPPPPAPTDPPPPPVNATAPATP